MKSQTPTQTKQQTITIGHLSPGVLGPSVSEVPVRVSHTLWHSLMWHYPLATLTDILEAQRLLDDLAYAVKNRSGFSCYVFYFPGNKPSWLRPDFLIKLHTCCTKEDVPSLLLLLPEEYPASLTAYDNLVPIGLLAALLRELYNLRLVARTTDFGPLDRLLRTVQVMANRHPLSRHVILDADVFKPSMPSYLCDTEFRALVLAKVSKLLNVLIGLRPTPLIVALRNVFGEFSKVSSEFRTIIESLVALAAKLPQASASPTAPLKQLLWAYHKASDHVQQNTSEPPPYLINCVQAQFAALSERLPTCFLSQLEDLYRQFHQLQGRDIALPERPSPATEDKPLWH